MKRGTKHRRQAISRGKREFTGRKIGGFLGPPRGESPTETHTTKKRLKKARGKRTALG